MNQCELLVHGKLGAIAECNANGSQCCGWFIKKKKKCSSKGCRKVGHGGWPHRMRLRNSLIPQGFPPPLRAVDAAPVCRVRRSPRNSYYCDWKKKKKIGNNIEHHNVWVTSVITRVRCLPDVNARLRDRLYTFCSAEWIPLYSIHL